MTVDAESRVERWRVVRVSRADAHMWTVPWILALAGGGIPQEGESVVPATALVAAEERAERAEGDREGFRAEAQRALDRSERERLRAEAAERRIEELKGALRSAVDYYIGDDQPPWVERARSALTPNPDPEVCPTCGLGRRNIVAVAKCDDPFHDQPYPEEER